MSDLMEMQSQRLRSLSRFLDNFKKIGKNNYTSAKISSRLELLRELWTEIKRAHQDILAKIKSSERSAILYFKDGLFDEAELIYQDTTDYIMECAEQFSTASTSTVKEGNSAESRVSNSLSLNHLPPIQLPQFNGSFTEWESFRDRFTALIINNSQLSNATKLHFLRSSLRDGALDCIKNLPITDDNFKISWDTLTFRFESKRKLINAHLASLLALPIVHHESSSELQSLVDRVQLATSQLKHIKRSPSDLWNDMLICLVTQRLDGATRKAWSLKFCKGSDLPSFEDLIDFLNQRIRALDDLKTSPVHHSRYNAPAIKSCNASFTSSSFKCSLCELSHPLSYCAIFKKKSPAQRLTIIKREDRCLNCLGRGHKLNNCFSKFSCRNCNQRHHTLLHDDSAHVSSTIQTSDQHNTAVNSSAQSCDNITGFCSDQ